MTDLRTCSLVVDWLRRLLLRQEVEVEVVEEEARLRGQGRPVELHPMDLPGPRTCCRPSVKGYYEMKKVFKYS